MEDGPCFAAGSGVPFALAQSARRRELRRGAERAADRRGGVRSDGGRQRPRACRAERGAGAGDREHDEDHDRARGARTRKPLGQGGCKGKPLEGGLVHVSARGRNADARRAALRTAPALRERRGGVHRRPLRRHGRAVRRVDERKGRGARHDAYLVCQPQRAGRTGALLLRARHGASCGVCHARADLRAHRRDENGVGGRADARQSQ